VKVNAEVPAFRVLKVSSPRVKRSPSLRSVERPAHPT
jgi:hypothetical protein